MVVRQIVHIDETLCTGCGNCIPKCAEDALQIMNGKAKIVKDAYCDGLGACLGHCPFGAITIIKREAESFDKKAVDAHLSQFQGKTPEKTVDSQWPVQLHLVPIEAPFYEGADLLIVADCLPVAYPELHEVLMPGRRIMIGCPKFDDVQKYVQKLSEILKHNRVTAITIAHMDVSCCVGLKWVIDKAIEVSGKEISIKHYKITTRGEIEENEAMQ